MNIFEKNDYSIQHLATIFDTREAKLLKILSKKGLTQIKNNRIPSQNAIDKNFSKPNNTPYDWNFSVIKEINKIYKLKKRDIFGKCLVINILAEENNPENLVQNLSDKYPVICFHYILSKNKNCLIDPLDNYFTNDFSSSSIREPQKELCIFIQNNYLNFKNISKNNNNIPVHHKPKIL